MMFFFFAKSHFEDEIFYQTCGSNLVTLSDLRRISGKKYYLKESF